MLFSRYVVDDYLIPCILVRFLLQVVLVESRWCTALKPVKATRTTLRREYKPQSSMDWFGLARSEWKLHTTTAVEYYTNMEVRNVCCHGYTFAEEHEECEPICEAACRLNSYCAKPNICQCNAGYINANVSEYQSPRSDHESPLSDHESPRSDLESPRSDRESPRSDHESPRLDHEYPRSDHESPRLVHEYHRSDHESPVCQPVCDAGCPAHSTCTAPSQCTCSSGYEGPTCEPICEPPCERADCAAPNKCVCQAGHELQPHALNKCAPSCKNCTNGECVAPGECQCWPGFVAARNTDSSDEESFDSCVPIVSEKTMLATLLAAETHSDFENTTELIALEHCQSLCRCWSELDELGIINTAGCQKLCADEIDRHCLDLHACRCIQRAGLQLICNSSDLESSEQESHVVYMCVMRLTRLTPDAPVTSESPGGGNNVPHYETETKKSVLLSWLLIAVVSSLVATSLGGIIWLIWHRIHSRPHSQNRQQPPKAELNVGFHSDDSNL